MSVRTSVVPAGITLTGSIEGKGDLVVGGTVEGPIDLDGDLVIEAGGEVRGDVRVQSLTVRGVLNGDASAKAAIRVEPSAMFVGDASAPRVNIVEGAKVRGRVRMTGEPIVPKARRRRRTEPRTEDRTEDRSEDRTEDRADAQRGEPSAQTRAPENRPRKSRSSREPRRRGPEARESARTDVARTEPAIRMPASSEAESPEPVAHETTAADPAKKRRRKRRRSGRKAPPPPTIPTVQRQKVRRKDRVEPPGWP